MARVNEGFDGLWRDVADSMHEQYAQAVADAARENGLPTADDISIDVETDSSDSKKRVDVERVRRRANQILAGR